MHVPQALPLARGTWGLRPQRLLPRLRFANLYLRAAAAPPPLTGLQQPSSAPCVFVGFVKAFLCAFVFSELLTQSLLCARFYVACSHSLSLQVKGSGSFPVHFVCAC